MAAQSLIAFVSDLPGFYLEGGFAFPMDALIQADLTPEQIIQDKVLTNHLAHFIDRSRQKFEGVDESVFSGFGLSKATIIADYRDNHQKLEETWELYDDFDSSREFDKRISWDHR